MDVPEDILDEAFAVFEEFGPDRRIDRRERLRAELNIQDADKIEAIMGCMKEISDTVWALAEQGGEIKLGKQRVRELIREKHPYLKRRGLQKAMFLVNYFAWHEGYDK